jgi:phosphoribosylanthranilate isomerase
MKLKICGMKYKSNILEVAQLLPDYMGFIFYEASKRHFQDCIPKLPDTIKKVGVFVNASLAEIHTTINKYQLQIVQLHGQETPEFCQALKSNGQTVIKVFSILDTFDFSTLTPYEAVCDFYLFDTKGPLAGGNGYTFDWSVLNDYPFKKPYFLSGGIGLHSKHKIEEFKTSRAAQFCCAIDVNSKFEFPTLEKNTTDLKRFKHYL